MSIPVSITSEVGALRAVLLHRPGRELESLTPQYLDSMLFEDIPFLEMMKEEHDRFAQVLSDQGCSVYYVESLLEEVLSHPQLQHDAIEYLVASSHLFSPSLREIIKDFLEAKTPKELVSYCIGGVLKTDIDAYVTHKTLSYYIRDAYPYYISPLPNLYFTRDPATTVGGGISVNLMKTESRRRENWLVSQIFHHHPQFSQARIHQDYTMDSSIEGGDILILNESTIIIGASARTDVWAIESFAKRMMSDVESGGEGFREILGVQIPFTRAYMHLDTVFTMVESDQRKATFLRTVVRELDLNANVISKRIEDIEPLQADIVTARALAPLPKLLDYAERHLVKTGRGIFLKGTSFRDELSKSLEIWRFNHEEYASLTDSESVILLIGDIERV